MEIVSRTQNKRFILLALALIILEVADGILTTYLLTSGLGYEGWPVVAPVAGYWWFGLAKLGITASVLLILKRRLQGQERNYRLANKALVALIVIFSLIVAWNSFVLLMGIL